MLMLMLRQLQLVTVSPETTWMVVVKGLPRRWVLLLLLLLPF